MEVSVIITNFNYDKYLARCVRSIINQSFPKDEYEIIIIDDCSTDNSKNIIEAFSGYIKPIYNDINIGLTKSCNKAIRSALGKYCIRIDSDDFVSKDFIKIHQMFLSNNDDIDATSCDYFEIDEKENILKRRNATTYPIACGIMYKVDDMIKLGLYDETLPREDIEYRQRYLKSGKQIYNINIPLYRYLKHSSSMTTEL